MLGTSFQKEVIKAPFEGSCHEVTEGCERQSVKLSSVSQCMIV